MDFTLVVLIREALGLDEVDVLNVDAVGFAFPCVVVEDVLMVV